MKKLVLALCFAYMPFFYFALAQTYGGITVLNSDITIQGNAFADDGCAPFTNPAEFSQKTCLITNQPLSTAGIVQALPSSDASNYCVLRAVDSDFCATTSATSISGMEMGGEGNQLILQWQIHSRTKHRTEVGCPYTATSTSSGSYELDIVIPSSSIAPGASATLNYKLTGFLAALSKSELDPPEDLVSAIVDTLELNGIDLMQSGGFTTSFTNGPGSLGGATNLSAGGSMNFTPDVPFRLKVDGSTFATILEPGTPDFSPTCGDLWFDSNGAVFFGNLVLSLSVIPPGQTTPPVFSFFSVDIGGASELSDPLASGTEYFDPGDAYRIKGPLLPPGGLDGFLDDASFLDGLDVAPSAPDPAVPSLTAAPVGSGLPLPSILSSYFNLDGMARTDFIVNPLNPGDVPPVFPLSASECVYRPFYLYLSFDDDAPGHYSDTNPSVPANSTAGPLNIVYGSGAEKDEVVEVFFLPPFLGGGAVQQNIASETDVHQNLAPNPLPFGPDPFNDDVDALSLGYNNACDIWYISVDHEARATDVNGLLLNPGTIYRVVPGNPGTLVPAISAPQMGLLPETDIDAFDFVRIFDPAVNPNGDILGLVFSVDRDDPLTPEDESAGLDPNTLYVSYLNGTFQLLDSALTFSENIDALSILPTSVAFQQTAQFCNPYNFTEAPLNLEVTLTPTAAQFTWSPYPYAVNCQISGNKITSPNDISFTLNPPIGVNPYFFSIPFAQLQPNQTYRARVRCGCSASNISPSTSYIFFTTPAGPSPIVDFFENPSMENQADEPTAAFSLYPNPASGFVMIESHSHIAEPVTLSIYNALGQEIHKEMLPAGLTGSHRMDTSKLPKGWYTVQIIWNGGARSLPVLLQ